MRLGVHDANVSHPGGPQAIGPRIAKTARVADQGGAAMVTVMDYWFQMWSPEDGSFDGRHYQLAETVCAPLPLQQPGPPIMIGGSGERKTLCRGWTGSDPPGPHRDRASHA